MTLKSFYYELRRRLKGALAIAKENGMTVEDGVSIMGDVNFGSEPYLITLRRKCRITNGVIFITHDGGTWAFRQSWSDYRDIIKFGRIEIGEESFIGARAIIMPNVKIGRNCVVGAGSVVTKDVPDESVVCGVPARVVCSTKEYAEKCKKDMDKKYPFFSQEEYIKDKKKYLLEHVK